VPRVAPGQAFAEKNVPEMAVAGGADDFGALPVGVGLAAHRARHLGVERGPTASGVEFVL